MQLTVVSGPANSTAREVLDRGAEKIGELEEQPADCPAPVTRRFYTRSMIGLPKSP